MSLFCPKCWAKAKCLESRTNARTNSVRRRFECLHADCKHRFNSVELIPGALDLRAGNGSAMMELVWEIFDKLGGDKAEQNFIEAWEQRKERQRLQRNESERKRYAAQPKNTAPAKKPASSHPWRESSKMLSVMAG